jgi:hypothetical protein
MLPPDLMLLHGEPSKSTLGAYARISQWLVLLSQFVASAAIMLSFTSGLKHNSGAVIVAFSIAAVTCYLWQPSMWGRRRRSWWVTRAGATGVVAIAFTAFLGFRVQHVDGAWTASWHGTAFFWSSIASMYVVIWGFIRTVIVEAIGAVADRKQSPQPIDPRPPKKLK